MRAHLRRNVVVERAGMRTFIRNPQLGEIVNNRFAFDFQFSRQIVDSNLTHFPSFSP